MRERPDAKLRVLVLWSPILAPDNQFAAVQASAFLDDPRAEHYWDLWGFGMKHYTSQLRYPKDGERAWDLFVLYRSRLKWNKKPPDPTIWMQNRGLPFGTPYSQGLLRTELTKLLKK